MKDEMPLFESMKESLSILEEARLNKVEKKRFVALNKEFKIRELEFNDLMSKYKQVIV